MELFRNKYRIESSRLKNWEYDTPWWYYVTINARDHVKWFGEVKNGEISLNAMGNLVLKYWQQIPEHFPDTELDYYVVMPNHVHGIIIINPPVETPDRASLHHVSLGQIVNQFKGSVKRWANKNGFSEFQWQRRFYDHIIRNEKDLYKIRKYIDQNPLKWDIEKNDPENIYL